MEVIPSLTKLDVTKENASQVRNEDYLSPQILGSCGHSGHLHSRRKLLVLDVNGLLVDIVADPDEAYRASADTIIGSKAVFKRPYCDEFLQFCFERFNVGVWTSRTRRNIERVLDFLIKDSQHQLLFCWPYTAIFPYTYCYRNTQDDGLGPEGDLRNYLERLAASENIQKFIEQNPFGQQPISNNDESWKFYLKVISGSSSEADLAAKSLLLRSRKKLIIIDVSGLLVDVVTLPREGYRADAIQGSKAVYKRPYCDEFLQFCFKRFNVGIWTSTTRFNIERLIDFLMRDTQHKLLFCWDHSHCTDTGFRTVENSCKPLVLKELKRLWEKQDPSLPWRKGEYDESNTLLLEHSPYKALLNPVRPEGDLRIYLERLAASENVQKFVEENPFGQRPITKKNLSWGFYHKVIRAFSSEPEADASCLLDAQCNNSSEPEADTTTPSVTRTLSVPKADIITASAAQVLSESKADTITASVPLSEPKADTITASAAQTSSEPKADTITASAAQTSSEPKADTITASAAQTSSEPKADIISASVAQTSSEPKADIITASVAQTSSEPKADIITASVAQTISEPEADSLAATQTLLEPSVANTNLSLNPANDGS
ncbi:HAD-like domain-containing protein [Cynara cardunculus var. scolymus]|uniref:HAD-like domain-containing protein n=1 Tax=Cynara cardunculus var. scolymus TaxID=59895 RepID=A0A103XX14_CYNCS|nr:HAD-like domain-containing protein [Cynara cardunculus var. scolymus]